MFFKSGDVSYVIARDKGGAYLMPSRYVGVEPPNGMQIERQKYPLKLRLDDEVHPQEVRVVGSDNYEYHFTRWLASAFHPKRTLVRHPTCDQFLRLGA